ncbi:hypothetical protein [Vibrio penaeicida]|uniref:hypothetical protein n=1 Tax=Vibrio penaeicida TaxID=104609 RepID=UPI000CEA55E7|nr:hypothetical protein [Vibrio penaeicida]
MRATTYFFEGFPQAQNPPTQLKQDTFIVLVISTPPNLRVKLSANLLGIERVIDKDSVQQDKD